MLKRLLRTLLAIGPLGLTLWLLVSPSLKVNDPKPEPAPEPEPEPEPARRPMHLLQPRGTWPDMRRSFIGTLNLGLFAVLGSVVAFTLGGTVYSAYAHNGVSHGQELTAATFEADACATSHGNQAPTFIPSGRDSEGLRLYIVDFTPTLREGLAHADCEVERYTLFNLATEAEDGLPGHWDDRVEWAELSYDGITAELARYLAHAKYGLVGDPTWDVFGVYVPETNVHATYSPFNATVTGGSKQEAGLAIMGYVRLSDLNLIGLTPVD
jgi:hypothetical protein